VFDYTTETPLMIAKLSAVIGRTRNVVSAWTREGAVDLDGRTIRLQSVMINNVKHSSVESVHRLIFAMNQHTPADITKSPCHIEALVERRLHGRFISPGRTQH